MSISSVLTRRWRVRKKRRRGKRNRRRIPTRSFPATCEISLTTIIRFRNLCWKTKRVGCGGRCSSFRDCDIKGSCAEVGVQIVLQFGSNRRSPIPALGSSQCGVSRLPVRAIQRENQRRHIHSSDPSSIVRHSGGVRGLSFRRSVKLDQGAHGRVVPTLSSVGMWGGYQVDTICAGRSSWIGFPRSSFRSRTVRWCFWR